MRPWTRLAVTSAFAGAFSIGFFGLHPEHFAAPLTDQGNYVQIRRRVFGHHAKERRFAYARAAKDANALADADRQQAVNCAYASAKRRRDIGAGERIG